MKRMTALFAALVLIFTLAACSKKAETASEEKTTVSSPAESVTEEIENEEEPEITEASEKSDAKTQKKDDSKKDGDKPGTTREDPPEDKPRPVPDPFEDTTKHIKLVPPATKAEIAKLYNNAVNKAKSSNAGFTKKVYNSEVKAELGLLSQFKDVIFGFLRIGDNAPETKAKGKSDDKLDLKTASLSASDIKEATCTKDKNGKWVINMTLNDGTTKSGSSAAAPVDKTGIFIGDKDKKHIDHKTADNYKYAIDNIRLTEKGKPIANVQSITETTTNVKVKAVVDPASGKPESITVSFSTSAHFTKLHISIVKDYDALDASLSSEIKYSDFRW